MDKELIEILDAAGLTAEQRTAAEAAFSIDALSKTVKNGFKRQSDYNRDKDALRKERETLNAKWDEAQSEYTKMFDSYTELTNDLTSTKAEKEAAAAKLAEAETKLAEAQKNQLDPTKVLTTDQFAAEQARIQAGQTAYFGDVLEIIPEHLALFGTRLSAKQLIQDAIAAKKPPMEFWEEKYGVPAKREEIAKAAEEKKMTEAETRGYQKRIAEEANPATREARPSQNPFYVAEAQGKQPWDEDAPSAAETKLMNELQAAHGSP